MRNVNLKKAATILSSIKTVIDRIPIASTVEMTEYSTNCLDTMNKQLDKLTSDLLERDMLINILTEIRNQVYEANFNSGIYRLLAQINSIELKLSGLKLVNVSTVAMTEAEISARINRLQKAETVNKYDCTFQSSVLSEENIANLNEEIATLEKHKRDINELLVEANFTNKITLSDSVEAMLLKHKII